MGNGWPKVPLGEVLSQVKREEPVDPYREYALLGAHWYAKGLYTKETKAGSEIRASKLYRVEEGDFVYNRLFAWKGSFALASGLNGGCHVSNEFPCFGIESEKLDGRFLWHYLSRESAWLEALGLSHGATPTSRNRLKEARFLAMQIPLPPLSEQRRIVAKIDRLAEKIEEAGGARRGSFREQQAVLPSARTAAFGKLALKVKPVRLDSVADCRLGKMLSRNLTNQQDGIPYMRNANVQWDRLDLSSVYRMNVREVDRTKLALQAGDILVCEGGDIGKSAIWNNEIPGCIYQKALHRVRVHRERLIPRFMLCHIFWAAEQGHFADIKTQTTIAHLTGVKLKAYPVYVPSLAEQRRIVEYLDGLQAKVDAIKTLQTKTAAELDALLPSILDKAFKGEL